MRLSLLKCETSQDLYRPPLANRMLGSCDSSQTLIRTSTRAEQSPSSPLGGSRLWEVSFFQPSTQGTSRLPLVSSSHHSRAGADGSAYRGAQRSRTLTPSQIHKPRKLFAPTFLYPTPLSFLQTVSSRTPPVAAPAGPPGPRPAPDLARQWSR